MRINGSKIRRWPISLLLAFTVGSVLPCLAAEKQHWSYSGDDGPQQWGNLSPEYDMCRRGRNQSPIDLSGTLDADLPELSFDYPNPGRVEEINNGHTILVNLKPGNFAMIREQLYEAKQFHFHSPSEHRISGASYPLEIHLVHANDAGELAVIGILFVEGERNPTLDQLRSFRPPELGPPSSPVDYNALFSSRNEYYTYNGSLTTPPCSEGVLWVVLKNPIAASKEQIDRFRDTLGFENNRSIQPSNARIILE